MEVEKVTSTQIKKPTTVKKNVAKTTTPKSKSESMKEDKTNDETVVKDLNMNSSKEITKNPCRKFVAGDMIPCKYVQAHKGTYYSKRTGNRYEWSGYGDVVEVDYTDLLGMKSSKSDYLYKPLFTIEDADLYSQWEKELEPIYLEFSGFDSPDELFKLSDAAFRNKLTNAPSGLLSLVKETVASQIKDSSFDHLSKIRILDEVLGTDFKDFI